MGVSHPSQSREVALGAGQTPMKSGFDFAAKFREVREVRAAVFFWGSLTLREVAKLLLMRVKP